MRWDYVALVLTSIATLIVLVLLGAALFGGFGIWESYADRVTATLNEKYYPSNHSFRDIFLQIAHFGIGELVDWTPESVAASLPHVSASGWFWSLLLARSICLGLLVVVIARHDEVFALGMGVFFVFVATVTNMYYWQMLALPALAWSYCYRSDPRCMAGLLVVSVMIMAEHLFIHFSSMRHLQGYFGSYWVVLLCGTIIASEILTLDPVRRRLGKFR